MAMMMADGQQEPPVAQLSSTYPSAPMEYVNMYTNENVKNGRAPMPPKIIKENYMSFGKMIDPNEVLILPLENQGIERLYSLPPPSPPQLSDDQPKPKSATILNHQINTNNHKRELKKLNHSILVAYLDLLDILVHAPNTQIEIEQPSLPKSVTTDLEPESTTPNVILKTVREQKLGDLEILFINMHHLINELRPHQARDTLRCILEMQRQQRFEMASKFKTHLVKIVDLLHNCLKSIGPNHAEKHDLDDLISNANQLTRTLDYLSSDSNRPKPTNGFLHEESNDDVEMKSIEEDEEPAKYEPENRVWSSKAHDLNLKNCDFRDLILCNLIDDEFMIKENEF